MSYTIAPATASIDEAAGTLTFTITRSATLLAETLFVSTTPDQGFANGGDYLGLLNRTVSFAAGQASLTVTVAITNDSIAEGNETFGIILQQFASDPTNVYLAKSAFTIADDDAPPPIAYSMTPGAAGAAASCRLCRRMRSLMSSSESRSRPRFRAAVWSFVRAVGCLRTLSR